VGLTEKPPSPTISIYNGGKYSSSSMHRGHTVTHKYCSTIRKFRMVTVMNFQVANQFAQILLPGLVIASSSSEWRF